MTQARGTHRVREIRIVASSAALSAVVAVFACSHQNAGRSEPASVVLRVGVPGLSPTNPGAGLRQLTQILSVEGLARLAEDGRLEPSLAADWSTRNNGRSYLIRLRPGVKFHDGSPLTPGIVASLLPAAMRETFGPIADDVEQVGVVDATTVEVRFRRPSPFLFESLEAGIRKPNAIATGPFVAVPNSTNELRANDVYYGGRPQIGEIEVETFPAVRTAWAKMLRNELDMLWEVGPDALSSLEHSGNVGVFTFTRRYQYALALNTAAPVLKSPAIRRALNMALDRTKLVNVALNGHGLPSSSPIWPRYWALDQKIHESDAPDLVQAAKVLTGGANPNRRGALHFTTLIASDTLYERLALEVKRQLEGVGIEMDVRAVSQDEQLNAMRHGQYEAVLIEVISGPTILRPYGFWHSRMPGNPGTFGNRSVDEAFDALRNAEGESAYRNAVVNLDRTFKEDPPALFLAWSVRARAVSKRFDVQGEEGRDVLSTLRFWKPTGGRQQASRH